MSHKIPDDIQDAVRRRAKFLCEYCHTSEHWQYVRFTMDHVNPDGGESVDNLALACFHCNRRKSSRTHAIDPEISLKAPLFNPRKDAWKDHFEWSEDMLRIIPKSSIGRATAVLLEVNRPRILSIRKADLAAARHPPKDDPIKA